MVDGTAEMSAFVMMVDLMAVTMVVMMVALMVQSKAAQWAWYSAVTTVDYLVDNSVD